MRYFNYITDRKEKSLFFLPPQDIDVNNKIILEHALGATLYMPATRKNVVGDIMLGKLKGLMSMVLCLEDAIGDREVEQAEQMLVSHFEQLSLECKAGRLLAVNVPMVFVRIRDVRQMLRIAGLLAAHDFLLTGFIFPKFSLENGPYYLEALSDINLQASKVIYGMPILESPDMIYVESRHNTLLAIKTLLNRYRHLILNVRIGATDLSGLFGVRRSPEMTIYDIAALRDCIADIVNVFGRPDDEYVISGPVWEFYSSERVFKPQLRQSMFTDRLGQAGGRLRNSILCRYIDGLIHEFILDKANGLTGKTIIHPSHIRPVQSLCVVTHEEYMDACSILQNSHGEVGVVASQYANKMNEIKPHRRWAEKIMLHAKIYGVFTEESNFTNLLSESIL